MKTQNLTNPIINNNPYNNVCPICSYSEYINELISSTGTSSAIEISLDCFPWPFEIFAEGETIFHDIGKWESEIITNPTWFDLFYQANKCLLDTNDFHLYLEIIIPMTNKSPAHEDKINTYNRFMFFFGS